MRALRARTEARPEPAESRYFNSLFGEILDWMLAPLLFLWPISIAVVYHVANDIASEPYDQSLSENVRSVARLIRFGDGQVSLDLPGPARELLRHDEQDAVYYQVLGFGRELVAGDWEIPWVDPPAELRPGVVHLRDGEIQGEDVRIAYQFIEGDRSPDTPPVLVQVAETRTKRGGLADRIIAGVLLPQFAIIPLAVILVYLGLGRGIKPLYRLQRLIERRRPGDLSPITTRGMPEEVLPLILAFNEMMDRLEQNLQAQQRFISDAAHQMRTPLTGLKMQTDLALLENDPEQIRSSLRQISDSADRAAHLINQLLSLARAEASSEKLHKVEAVNLEELLRDVVRELVPQARAKRIDIGLELTGWPLTIEGNPVQLRELLKNLVDNAIKYTPEGGKVTARTLATAFAIVEIEDSGIGIAEDERELVFERFYRSLGSGAAGSGLGLAIVREIADLHRANVLLKPNPGGPGTLAQVSFPRARGPSIPVADEARGRAGVAADTRHSAAG
jgi:two-component system sensor histidine kinase TctE